MGFGISSFTDQSTTSLEIPGLTLPAFDSGYPKRVCPKTCNDLSCSKRSSHKGYMGFHYYGISGYALQKQFIDQYNAGAERVRQIQAALMFSHVLSTKVNKYENNMRLADGSYIWREYSWEVTSLGSYTIYFKYTSDNDPAKLEGNKTSFCDVGYGWVTNSSMAHGGLMVYNLKTNPPDANGNGTGTISSLTPIPARLSNKANGSQPQTLTVRVYSARMIFSDARNIYPLWAKPEIKIIEKADLVQGANTVEADATCVPIGFPFMKSEVMINDNWEGIGTGVYNKPNGNNGYDVCIDMSAWNWDAIQKLRVQYWKESAPSLATTSTIPVEIDSPTQQLYTVATNKRATVLSAVYECKVWDSGYVWKPWTPPNQIYNELNDDGWFDVKWDLTGAEFVIYPDRPEEVPPEDWNPDPIPIEAVRVTFEGQDKDTNVVLSPCGDRCFNSIPEYSSSVGVYDGTTGTKFYCHYWSDLDQTQKNHFTARSGKCLNTTCPYFAVDRNERDLWSYIPGLASSRTLVAEQNNAFDPNNITLQRVGSPSLETLCNDYMQGTGTRYKARIWYWDTGSFGKTVFDSFPITVTHTESRYNDETGEYEDVEVSEEITLSTVGLSGGNVRDFASKWPLSNGITGKQIHQGNDVGSFGKCVTYSRATVLAPKIQDVEDWQQFEVIKVKNGLWDANLNELTANNQSVAYRMLVQVRNGIKPFYDPNDSKETLNQITTCKPASVLSSGDSYTLALNHKPVSVLKPAGTNEEDAVVSVKIGNTNVLLPQDLRTTNAEAYTSIRGAGGGDVFINAGHALQVPADDAIPKRFWNRIIPITAAVACNESGIVQPGWNTDTENLQKLENVMGLGAGIDRLKYCDTITLDDSVEHTLADMQSAGVDLTEIDFSVVEGHWCNQYNSWESSSPTDNDTEITGVKALPYSGMYFFPDRLTDKCLVGDIDLADFMSIPSVSNDLNPITTTLDNLYSR